MKKRIIVVGNGMVGYKFCEKLRSRSTAVDIIVYGEEPRPAYDRVHLSSYFSGSTAEDLLMAPAEWYTDNNIALHTGELVTEINRVDKTIRTHTGRSDKYDYLVLATGSGAFVPSIEGVERDGVFVYRTIEDLVQITAYAKKVKRGAVMGGGLLGLEAAKALLDLGLETHVVEFAPRLMPRQIDDAGSDVLAHKLSQLGITIHTGKSTKKIEGNGKLEGLLFADDTKLDIEMLVISAGIRPRDELAKATLLNVHPRGGIKALRNADVILYDALVSPELLELVKPTCKRVYVGKRKGKKEFSQEEINQLIVFYATRYTNIVRLKGGDSYVFGRGHEELEYAMRRGVQVEVVPGVSSALAAPASCGIPLTKRGVNESFWVITGMLSSGEMSKDIAIAAQSSATVVILMGMTHLEKIAQLFLQERSASEPVAVIQHATTPMQKNC